MAQCYRNACSAHSVASNLQSRNALSAWIGGIPLRECLKVGVKFCITSHIYFNFYFVEGCQEKKLISFSPQTQLNLEHVHMKALLDADLSSVRGIQDSTKAAQALLKCMQADIHPG